MDDISEMDSYEDCDDEMDDNDKMGDESQPKPRRNKTDSSMPDDKDPVNLSFDNSAYKLFHSCDCEYPCMTIDSIKSDSSN